ncbi:uncharacterized protein LOC124303355 [Neodiprion virginianus]|uniref:uncharacterized protein LOC124303355 n=1 Tax=Neodiprion virginianus TaxID=2961670 RepID=UPI001EE7651F|nr:uncharacterized protein LOC124303355 [Neodiprion virginianus]
MFAATISVLIVFSLCENEVQCSTIRRQVFSRETQNLTKPTKLVTFLKRIDNAVIQNPLEVSALLDSQREINLSGEREVKEADRVTISKGKNRLTKNDAKRRKPKFLGSLPFAKLLNGAIALHYLTPGYFTTLYEPQSYFPYLYPVPYPVPGIGSNFFPNFPSGIPTKPPTDRIVTSVPLSKPVPQQISNLSAPVELQVVDTTLDNDKVTTEKEDDAASELQEQAVDDAEKEISEAQATQVDLKRAVPSDVKDELDTDPIVESVNNDGPELGKLSLTRKTSTPTPTSTSTTVSTTDVPTNTTMVPNVTLSTTSAGNGTELSPFYGYYGGMPQDLEHLLFTTENPQQRYLDDYNPEKFALPFQRPATFNPYPNAEAYPSPFVNSFSPRERFPEFLNTVEADRYFYDSQNKPNFDGFRPILK